MTLHLGTWLLPFAVTLAALFLANREYRGTTRDAAAYALVGAAAVGLIAYLLAAVVSLVAWLAWTLFG
jgi:hypothetical protein